MQWQGAFCSTHSRGPSCYIEGTVCGGGFHPPKLPRCPGNASAENVPEFPSSKQLVLAIPQPGSSAALPWPESLCSTSAVLHLWPRLSNYISPVPLSHVVLLCVLASIQLSSTTCTPYTAPVTSAAPFRKVPLLSYIACTPPPTWFLPPGMGNRPCQLSYRH